MKIRKICTLAAFLFLINAWTIDAKKSSSQSSQAQPVPATQPAPTIPLKAQTAIANAQTKKNNFNGVVVNKYVTTVGIQFQKSTNNVVPPVIMIKSNNSLPIPQGTVYIGLYEIIPGMPPVPLKGLPITDSSKNPQRPLSYVVAEVNGFLSIETMNQAAQSKAQAALQTNPSAEQKAESIKNGVVMNNSSQTIQVQFMNTNDAPISPLYTINSHKSLPIPTGASLFTVFVPNMPMAMAPIGHSSTNPPRNLSYVVTKVNNAWKIEPMNQAAQQKAQATKAS